MCRGSWNIQKVLELNSIIFLAKKVREFDYSNCWNWKWVNMVFLRTSKKNRFISWVSPYYFGSNFLVVDHVKNQKSPRKGLGKLWNFLYLEMEWIRLTFCEWYIVHDIFNVLSFLICVILQVELSSLTAESQSYQEQVSVPFKGKEEQKLLVNRKGKQVEKQKI